MTATGLQAPPEPAVAVTGRTGWPAALGLAAVALGVTLAGASLAAPGAPLRVVLAPVVLMAGVVAVAAALYQIEAFLLGALVVRSSLDALGGAASRATEPATLLGGLFIVASLAWLFVNRDRLARPSSLTWAAVAFAGSAGLSLPGSVVPGQGLVDLIRMTGAVLLLVIVEQVIRSDGARLRLLIAMAVSAVVPLIVLATQYLRDERAATYGDVSRFTGTFNHPNPFAAYLGLLVVVFLAVRAATGWWSPLFTTAALACGVGLVATYARGAWVGAMVGIVVVAARVDRRLLARLAVVVVAGLVLVPSVGQRVTDFDKGYHLNGTPADSLTWRFNYWGDVLELAGNPVTGIGLAGVEAKLDLKLPPHNDFLRVFVETGLVGLAAYGVLLVAMALVAWRAAQRAPTQLGRAVGLAAIGCVIAFVWLSVSSNLIAQVVILWYLWATLGAAAATLTEAREP